jgi:peptidoglycan/xylan/chitin deacetylase (PgdA/CDA1 family)
LQAAASEAPGDANPAARTEAEPAGALVPGRWRPTPFIGASLVLHVVALVALVLAPAWWPWMLGAVLANHLLVCLSVPFIHSGLTGAILTRLPAAAAARGEIALTFDDGPNPEVTPQVLDLLEAQGMRASFFCIAQQAAAHPELVREIVRRGHQVENHSDCHGVNFSLYGYRRLAREVDAAQATLTGIAGRAPRFFRAPAGFRSPFLDPILQRRGIRCISWTRRGYDAFERDPARVLARLSRKLAAGDVLLMHDGAPAHTREGAPLVLAVLPALMEQMRQHGLKSVPLSIAYAQGRGGL